MGNSNEWESGRCAKLRNSLTIPLKNSPTDRDAALSSRDNPNYNPNTILLVFKPSGIYPTDLALVWNDSKYTI